MITENLTLTSGAPRLKNDFKAWAHECQLGHDEWLTPPEIIKALGEFDLDPCSPINRPWPTAKQHYTIEDNGLLKAWSGRVWMNPPYGREMSKWIAKLAEHGDGIALIFARTDTEVFHQHIFAKADAMLFVAGRIQFFTVNGEKGKSGSGAPSVLVAYGLKNVAALYASGIEGRIVTL